MPNMVSIPYCLSQYYVALGQGFISRAVASELAADITVGGAKIVLQINDEHRRVIRQNAVLEAGQHIMHGGAPIFRLSV